MKNFGTEFKVGMFTIVSAIIIGYMFFVLSPETFSNKGKLRFYTVVQNASGIVVKTHVKTNGVTVGKVRDIKLQVNSTRIEIEIEDVVKIPEGSKIAIKEKGLLGDVFMEIIRSDDLGQYIEPGGYIPPDENQVSLGALLDIGGSIARDVKKITAALSQVLGGKEGEKNIEEFVRDVKAVASNLNGILNENRNGVKNIVSNIDETTAVLRRVIGGNEGELESIVANIEQASLDLKKITANVRDLVDDDNKERIEKILASFDKTMQDVEVTAKSVRLVANKVENGEGTLGRLVNDEKTLSELEGAIQDVRKILAPATKLKVTVDYHGELRKDEVVQHYFNMAFRTRPDKYYLLGFTDTTESVKDTIIEPVSADRDQASVDQTGPMTKSRERVVERSALRFNAQIAKRWNDFQVRFGLFESTGGIAGDYYLIEDRFRFTIEAFNWDSKSYLRRTARFKSYMSVLFFKHIYVIAGVDDVTRLDQETGKVDKNPNWFVGAGLNFDDEDLKAIFGTAALMR